MSAREEYFGEVALWIYWLFTRLLAIVLLLTIFLGVLYLLVRFVRWAWDTPIPLW